MKGTDSFLTIFDLLLQIIEVHCDLGLEVPAPRPKSRLSLKCSRPRPTPPSVEVTPPRPTSSYKSIHVTVHGIFKLKGQKSDFEFLGFPERYGPVVLKTFYRIEIGLFFVELALVL